MADAQAQNIRPGVGDTCESLTDGWKARVSAISADI